jgi:Zn finger protein HypA/HybF involved in hydrogenase expression
LDIAHGPPLKRNRLNPYHIAVISSGMVVIQCPHCEEEIELDDDAFGEFQCPHCEGEFEWGEKPKARVKGVKILSQ